MSNLAPLLDEYAELNAQKKAIEAKLKELGEVVRPLLVGQGLVATDNATFEVKQVAGRKSLDKDALLDAGIDLEPYYKVGKPFTTLYVKAITKV